MGLTPFKARHPHSGYTVPKDDHNISLLTRGKDILDEDYRIPLMLSLIID